MAGETVHIVNAFTTSLEGGNPAGVCLPERDLPQRMMQRIATEVNLSETAFVRPEGEGFSIRWFTPTIEVDLCGHATLASAHALWETGRVPPDRTIHFQSASGPLTATRRSDWIELDFPADPPEPTEEPSGLAEALGVEIQSVHRARIGHLAEIGEGVDLRAMQPDFDALGRLPIDDVIVTRRPDVPGCDFLSRFFAPKIGIDEDPVTGAAHCALAPYWARRLGKDEMVGHQVSARSGVVRVRLAGDRVILGGQAVTAGTRVNQGGQAS